MIRPFAIGFHFHRVTAQNHLAAGLAAGILAVGAAVAPKPTPPDD
jgi:hypothetical protein